MSEWLIAFRLALFLGLAGTVPALAQGAGARDGASDAGVSSLVQQALTNIQRARCDGDKPCAVATAEELANPPISLSEARSVIRRGVINGAADLCALDWRTQSFLPMMAYWRQQQRKTERQMALIGLLHGISQGRTQASLKQQGCNERMRANLQVQLAFKP